MHQIEYIVCAHQCRLLENINDKILLKSVEITFDLCDKQEYCISASHKKSVGDPHSTHGIGTF